MIEDDAKMTNWRDAVASAHEPRLAVPGAGDPQRAVAASTSTGSCASRRSGFDVAAVPDHFCDWGNPSGPWHEAWTGIAAIAARTSTIRLTTCVTQIAAAQPGRARPPGRHRRSDLRWPAGARHRHRPHHRSVVRHDRRAQLEHRRTRGSVRRVHRAGRPTAGRGRHHLPRHLLPGQRCGDESWIGAAATIADHGRRARSADDAPRRRSRRHLEQLELRRRLRGAARRVGRPLHDDGRAVRRGRPRPGDAAPFVHDVRSEGAGQRGRDRLLRVRRRVRRDGASRHRSRDHRDLDVLPGAR